MRVSAQAFAPVKNVVCGRKAIKRAGARLHRLLPLLTLLPFLAMQVSCHHSSTTTSPISIVVDPTDATLNIGMSTMFGAAVSGGTLNTVTWSVNGTAGGSMAVGTILVNGSSQPTTSSTGNVVSLTNYTAPATLPTSGQVTITATSVDDTTVSTSVTLTLLPNAVVTVTPANTPTLAPGGQIPFSATVQPAPSANVIWEVNGLPGGYQTLGIISNAGVYTAPASPPLGGSVTITAVSVADTTQSGSATVGLTFGTSSLQGPYAFTLKGKTAAGTFVRAGSFMADGQGHLASGVEDMTGSAGSTHITFTGSDTVGADGRGTLAFNDGLSPAQFHIVMPSSAQAQIVSYDPSGTAFGVANLQSVATFKTASFQGTYLFNFAGLDSSGNPISEVGEFVANGQGAISSGIEDVNDNGTLTAQTPFTGTYTVNSNGSGAALLGTSAFDFYIVNSGEIKFVAIGASPAPAVVGHALQQAPNATFTQSSLSGNYAFFMSGGSATGNIATVGSFTTTGNGLLTSGVLDENNAGVVAADQAFTGTYAISATGRGTATLNALNRTYTLVFYLDGQGGGIFQETDSGITSDGSLAQQQSAPGLAGSYALSLTGMTGATTQQIAGQFSVNSSGTITSGNLDSSSYPGAGQTATLSGTLAVASGTRGTLSLIATSGNHNFVLYPVSSTKVFTLETDSGVLADGSLFKQF
jgi:hypothetical protein